MPKIHRETCPRKIFHAHWQVYLNILLIFPSCPFSTKQSLQQTLDTAKSHLLAQRYALFNVAAFALLGAAWAQGWIAAVLAADDTGLSLGIVLVFLAGLGLGQSLVDPTATELRGAVERALGHSVVDGDVPSLAGCRRLCAVAGRLLSRERELARPCNTQAFVS